MAMPQMSYILGGRGGEIKRRKKIQGVFLSKDDGKDGTLLKLMAETTSLYLGAGGFTV